MSVVLLTTVAAAPVVTSTASGNPLSAATPRLVTLSCTSKASPRRTSAGATLRVPVTGTPIGTTSKLALAKASSGSPGRRTCSSAS